MSVALHYMPYTAGSLAARNGPSGTRGGFSYTVPSPSSTASSCSLRLSGANTSQRRRSGPRRAVGSPVLLGEDGGMKWNGDTSDGGGERRR